MKYIFFLLMIVAFNANAQYAHTVGTKLDASMLPSGVTNTSVTALVNPVQVPFAFNVPGTLDNASSSAWFTAIKTAVRDTVLLGYMLDDWSVDTSDLTVHTYITSIKRGYNEFDINDYQMQYKVGTDVYKIVGYTQWKKQ